MVLGNTSPLVRRVCGVSFSRGWCLRGKGIISDVLYTEDGGLHLIVCLLGSEPRKFRNGLKLLATNEVLHLSGLAPRAIYRKGKLPSQVATDSLQNGFAAKEFVIHALFFLHQSILLSYKTPIRGFQHFYFKKLSIGVMNAEITV